MKETPRRRISDNSPLSEISTDQLGEKAWWWWWGRGDSLLRPPPFHSKTSPGQIFIDDVNGFIQLCSDICFIANTFQSPFEYFCPKHAGLIFFMQAALLYTTIEACMASSFPLIHQPPRHRPIFKATVSRDFLLQILTMNHVFPSPWKEHWGHFEFFRKLIYMLTQLPKGVQKKQRKLFWLQIFYFCHRCQRHRWCTLNCEYIRP